MVPLRGLLFLCVVLYKVFLSLWVLIIRSNFSDKSTFPKMPHLQPKKEIPYSRLQFTKKVKLHSFTYKGDN
ncbi:uncharacterized protein SPAPADRAFT_63676 [Spathaspora passalidarum NRRL Y-27907]|uniref:Uncharacterized protein n=1 Tax=Spathaspora passalidarum (strain NRRL Y-27907 / 11-Y1) TaxID=619300 RepID=G3AUW8_SPAPN|nr:uncharacterized protein SPAPADRAFT_63676 [Spathaspora passalidarum NRRL Y-27907]EGW30059.1 hypothetical protein SPAPADRAFT_63676 [Spathaspora passalidarum NRRL Y-27907]